MTDQDAIDRILSAFEGTEKRIRSQLSDQGVRLDGLDRAVTNLATEQARQHQSQLKAEREREEIREVFKRHTSGITKVQRGVSETDAKHASDMAAIVVQVGTALQSVKTDFRQLKTEVGDDIAKVATAVTEVKNATAAHGATLATVAAVNHKQTQVLDKLTKWSQHPAAKAVLTLAGALLAGYVGAHGS